MSVHYIQSSDPAFISQGAGNDRYIVSSLIAPGQTVTIADGEGQNTLQLEFGTQIISSTVTGNYISLTLSNGAVVSVANADKFTFISAPTDTATGVGGDVQTFEEFVVNTLGLDSVPTGFNAVEGGPVSIGPQWIDSPEYGWVKEDTYISGQPGQYRLKIHVYDAPGQDLMDGIANAAEAISEIIQSGGMAIDLFFVDVPHYTGKAWVYKTHPETMLPVSGRVNLDKDQSQRLSDSLFEDLALHEFLHCLGFGLIWDKLGLIENDRFTGPNAIAAYHSEFASIVASDPNSHLGVPVEMDGPSGTAGKHWDEVTFGREMMTSYLQGTNHVSNMTIAALQDMGYEVII